MIVLTTVDVSALPFGLVYVKVRHDDPVHYLHIGEKHNTTDVNCVFCALGSLRVRRSIRSLHGKSTLYASRGHVDRSDPSNRRNARC